MLEMTKKKINDTCCPPKPRLEKRPLLSAKQAARLAAIFKILANDTRLRILHALTIAQELPVGDIAKQVGMKPQAVSNQLQRLADQGIVGSRREGQSIHYQIIDPCVEGLLDQGLCLAEDAAERTTK